MSENKLKTLENLKRLINHPATPTHEREAAQCAINRILGLSDALDSELKKTKKSFATIFKKSMARSFAQSQRD